MSFIPRQVKPPARLTLTCKVPAELATVLKQYAEFLDSTQEYVVTETLRLAFRKDKEFHAWLVKTHPETRMTEHELFTTSTDQPRRLHGTTGARARAVSLSPSPTVSEQDQHRTDIEALAGAKERARP